MGVTHRLASLNVALHVLDGGPALREAFGDVKPVGHDQAIRDAADWAASE